MRRTPARAAIFVKTAKIAKSAKIKHALESQFNVVLKWFSCRGREGLAEIFAKTAKIANIVKSAKIWKIRQVNEKRVRRAPARAAIFVKTAKIVKSAKIKHALESQFNVVLKWFSYRGREERLAEEGLFFSPYSADRLAQLVEYRTTVREVVGSNPGRTNT